MSGLALILLILGALAVTALSRRAGLPAPLVLVVVGLAASEIPGFPDYELDPDLVLYAVLPPLLYAAALGSSAIRIKANIRPIALLAVGLVLFTAVCVGLVAWWLIPALPLSAALVLGAVVAPPDAVAATAIGRRLGLPRRVMTVLDGESLFNDATALTAVRVGVAATAGAAVSVWGGALEFLLIGAGGALLGALLGYVVHQVRLRLAEPTMENAIGLVVPFAAYALAEQIHASGVLAVVAAGLYLGHRAPEAGYATRLQDRAVWKAVTTILEAFVFAVIGLQLRSVLEGVRGGMGTLLVASCAVLATAVLARMLWVSLTTYLPPAASLFRRRTSREPPPSWREPAVISWAGMRGVVTLAAAFSIPTATEAGAPFPGRSEIIFVAFFVTVGTLLLHGLTLPWVIRKLGVTEREQPAEVLAEAAARQAAIQAGIARLDDLAGDAPESVASRLRSIAEHRSHRGWERLGRSEDDLGESPSSAYRRLRTEMLAAERETLVSLRDAGRIDDEVLTRSLHDLDLEEAMLNTWSTRPRGD